MKDGIGRPLSLTETLKGQLEALIGVGVPIKDACVYLDVDESSFYRWRNLGMALHEQESVALEEGRVKYDADGNAHADLLLDAESELLLAFYKGTSRAQARAKVTAVGSLRSAIAEGGEEKSETTEVVTETRLRRVRRTVMEDDGRGGQHPVTYEEQVPYEHKTTRRRTSVRRTPPDGRLALEFLARRDPKEWAQRKFLDVEWRDQAKEDILRGALTWEVLVAAYGEEDAALLFNEIGMPVPQLPQGTGLSAENGQGEAASG